MHKITNYSNLTDSASLLLILRIHVAPFHSCHLAACNVKLYIHQMRAQHTLLKLCVGNPMNLSRCVG